MPIETVIGRIRANKCPTCGKFIVLTEFKDLLSLREYEISGMCQLCQDEVFTDEYEDEFYEEEF